MGIETLKNLLDALVEASSPTAIRGILGAIGDQSDLALDQPFGPLQLCWHAYGDNSSNLSSIGLSTKPGRSLTERLTNAMDAELESRAPVGSPLPNSPRLAARQWFGRPITGPDEGLFKWPYGDSDADRLVNLLILPSDSERSPTIDVVDAGIGLTPDAFPKTILSLQSGNKISKFYLIGAFGQGGASTLAFADYVIILSRSKSRPLEVAFTVIRVLSLGESFKEDAYAYLATTTVDGQLGVPSVMVGEGPLDIYRAPSGMRVPALQTGTVVRHVGYKLPDLAGSLSPSPGNLYHYLHALAFDPLLPFRLIDLRDLEKSKDELVTGSRNRLMKLASRQRKDATEPGDETGSQIAHYRPMEFVVPFGSEEPSIGVEYWVVLNYRKSKVKGKEEPVLRSYSNELFVNRTHPIIGTLNGQNQGEMSAQIVREVGLSMVARHLVVHIDASRAARGVRRELFSTTREGFKEGDILTELVRTVRKMLQEDEVLQQLERELTDKLAKRESEGANAEVKNQVTKLLLDAGLKVSEAGVVPTEDSKGAEKHPTLSKRTGRHRRLDPLPTLPFPQVTRFELVHPKPSLQVRLNDSEVILVETDADAEFDTRGLLGIRFEPDLLELAGKSPLRGGRARWRVRPRQAAVPGSAGVATLTITRPDGTQLTDAVPFEVLPSLEATSRKDKGLVPPFEIVPINPDDDQAEWSTAWPDLTEEVGQAAQASVAYRPVLMAGKTVVYYSTIFNPFREVVDRLKASDAGTLAFFESNYAVWIGYHAILQDAARRQGQNDVPEETLDDLLEQDRTRVAKLEVKQALRIAELLKKSSASSEAGE